MPNIGYGTWNRDDAATYQGVIDALDVGYRHIDTAQAYGNEAAVGKAIADSAIPRDDIFLTTKVDPINYGEGKVLASVKQSLIDLQTEQVDLLLLHFPALFDEFPVESYVQQLVDVYNAGLCKNIGVSNFTKHYLSKALPLLGDIKLFTNQVEIHAYMQNKPIVEFCQQHNIHLTAYSPLARGALLNDSTLTEIAANHQVTTSQIALAFLLNKGYTVIPSSANKQRIIENFNATNIELTPQEMAAIQQLDQNMRLVDEDWCPKWD